MNFYNIQELKEKLADTRPKVAKKDKQIFNRIETKVVNSSYIINENRKYRLSSGEKYFLKNNYGINVKF